VSSDSTPSFSKAKAKAENTLQVGFHTHSSVSLSRESDVWCSHAHSSALGDVLVSAPHRHHLWPRGCGRRRVPRPHVSLCGVPAPEELSNQQLPDCPGDRLRRYQLPQKPRASSAGKTPRHLRLAANRPPPPPPPPFSSSHLSCTFHGCTSCLFLALSWESCRCRCCISTTSFALFLFTQLQISKYLSSPSRRVWLLASLFAAISICCVLACVQAVASGQKAPGSVFAVQISQFC
jgi:hypothetical protein